jgi:hypothetical protein
MQANRNWVSVGDTRLSGNPRAPEKWGSRRRLAVRADDHSARATVIVICDAIATLDRPEQRRAGLSVSLSEKINSV